MTRGAIICVDDELMVLLSLRDQLNHLLGGEYQIELAQSGEEALELFAGFTQAHIPIPLVICDQTMAGMAGVELLCRLHTQYPETLKILLTGLVSLDQIVQAVNYANLYRYVTKPWDPTDLGLTVKEALRRYEQEYRLSIQNQALQKVNLELQHEIQERRRAEAQLAHDSLHDALTGLPNRTLLTQRLEQIIHNTQTRSGYQFALLYIDLDRFKIINDSLGHLAGDQFLVTITHRLLQCLRSQDMVARLGGDEFTILLEPVHGTTEATNIAQRILDVICAPLTLQGHMLFPSASIGIVIGSAAYQNTMNVLRDADLAMYEAKKTGKACYALFSTELHTQTFQFLQIESALRQALEHQEFRLHYQPIVSLRSGDLIGFEALIRWQHSEKGFISPAEFIPIAEETGFIIPLGEWVLREACRQLHLWHQTFPDQGQLIISVNLASKQLRQPELVSVIDSILAEMGLKGQFLKLELTESMLIDDIERVLQTLHSIRVRGIQLSIDDFGTGYSSLSYLPRFPINALKIDRSFTSRMVSDPENLEIVRAIISLAKSINIEVIAEGIETSAEITQLQQLGCGFGQGYWFSKPLGSEAAAQLIAEQTCCRLSDIAQNRVDYVPVTDLSPTTKPRLVS
jgi:diguanylate cyclase (GGDEF)-like protein